MKFWSMSTTINLKSTYSAKVSRIPPWTQSAALNVNWSRLLSLTFWVTVPSWGRTYYSKFICHMFEKSVWAGATNIIRPYFYDVPNCNALTTKNRKNKTKCVAHDSPWYSSLHSRDSLHNSIWRIAIQSLKMQRSKMD